MKGSLRCSQCKVTFLKRHNGQRFCSRKCVGVSHRNVEKWQARELKIALDAQWGCIYRGMASVKSIRSNNKLRRSVHATVLERNGLPPNIAAAARFIGITTAALRRRICLSPNRIFRPLRAYLGRRPTMVHLRVPVKKLED